MPAAVLSDFGSTVCKVTVVDLDTARVLGHGEAPTFLGADVMEGYDAAYGAAVTGVPGGLDVAVRLSSSSAGGGLRMGAVGLVEEMTAAAAGRAALNAGGRLELVLHGHLDEADLAQLDRVDPEIVLFGGGTDGGQRDLVLANASALTGGTWSGHVVVACNREVSDEVAGVFQASGRPVHVVDNIMPRIGTVQVDQARARILEVFLSHVIKGKNLSDRREFLDAVVTATPEAALAAARLLAFGTDRVPGVGHALVLDVGGATTDVHSVRTTAPPIQGRRGPLLPIPTEQRTVHGDLGMRSGARGAVDSDTTWLTAQTGLSAAEWVEQGARRAADPSWIATLPDDLHREELLGTSCITHALARHCGRQSWLHSKDGNPTLSVTGPDLRDVVVMVGTGGVVVHHEKPNQIIEPALNRAAQTCMAPSAPAIVVDHGYVLAAAGLLRHVDDDTALRMLRAELGLGRRDTAFNAETLSGKET